MPASFLSAGYSIDNVPALEFNTDNTAFSYTQTLSNNVWETVEVPDANILVAESNLIEYVGTDSLVFRSKSFTPFVAIFSCGISGRCQPSGFGSYGFDIWKNNVDPGTVSNYVTSIRNSATEPAAFTKRLVLEYHDTFHFKVETLNGNRNLNLFSYNCNLIFQGFTRE